MLKETGVVTMLGRTSGDGSCTLISVAVRLHHNREAFGNEKIVLCCMLRFALTVCPVTAEETREVASATEQTDAEENLLSSSCGIEFANSAANSKIVTDSGESVDFGCPVDAELISDSENPYENFYDLARFSELMNEYYAALDEAT